MHTSQGQLPEPYRITDVIVENPTVRSFVLDRPMELTPGQFVMAWLPGLDEKPFSPSRADPLTLTVTRVGPFTSAMHELAVGRRVWLRGPFGQGFRVLLSGQGRAILLIGGGCGAAPLRALAESARRMGWEVHVVLGARSADGLFFAADYAALGCHVHLSTDDGAAGWRGTSVDLAASLCKSGVVFDTLYACGPRPMLDAAYRLAQQYGLPAQLSYEAFMRCGIGVCGSCACGGQLVCRDGPVFSSPPD